MKILWIPHAGWHIPQRAHLFCKGLAERHEIHVTDWVADFSTLRDYFTSRYAKNWVYRKYNDGNITVHGIPRISPALYLSSLRHFNSFIFSKYIKMIIKEYSLDIAVGTFIVPPPNTKRLIYDVFDDNVAYWQAYGLNKNYALEISEVERCYLELADCIVVASSVLAERVVSKGVKKPVIKIPNGVDLSRFEKMNRDYLRKVYDLKGKIVGVIGNHDKEIEINRIFELANMFSAEDITFIIAGRGSVLPIIKKRIKQEGINNVICTGYISFERAIDVVASFDVGLCPYRKTSGADASSPMRLLQYSAGGIPTVCTNLEEVCRMRFPNVVIVEDSTHSFADGIRLALEMPKCQPKQLKNYDLHQLLKCYEKVLSG